MGEISLRHIPDLSDASAVGDFSDASFQIPRAVGNADDLLLADDTMDFFNGVNDTLSTPAPPSKPAVQPPLTLAELTPRSKPMRAAVARSSLRPRPGVATPYKAVVASELSAALSEDLSPFRNQDPSFQIPPPQANGEDLLLAVDGVCFLEEQVSTPECTAPRAPSPLTLSQLTPGPSKRMPPPSSVSPVEPTLQSPALQSLECVPDDDRNMIGGSEVNTTVSLATASTATDSAAAPSQPIGGSAGKGDQSPVEPPADTGKAKELPAAKLAERQKKLPGGDKVKRKRVTPAAAVTKPAKLKPLTASLARRASNAGSKFVPGMRRRPLLGVTAATSKASTSIRRLGSTAQSTTPAIRTDVKPTRTGGLADTLMSFGRQLMASAASPEQHGEACAESGAATASVPEATAPAPIAIDHPSDARPVNDQVEKAVAEPSYLSLSQLSPRRDRGGESSATLASGSHGPREAPASVLNQLSAEPQVSEVERPPSPMRRSIKRAGSPSCEPQGHQRKRSKTTSGHSAPTSSKECAPRKPALQPSRARNVPAAASTAGAGRARRVVSASASSANLRAKADDVRKLGIAHSRSHSRSGPGGEVGEAKTRGPGRGQVLDGENGVHVLAISEGGRSGDASDSQRENTPDAQERQTYEHRDGQASSRGPSTADRPPLNLPSAKPTRPVEFQFATSTRIEGRKADLEKSHGSSSSSGSTNGASLRRSKAHAAHPIPDFKALHAMQQSVLAQRKAEIVPVVPMPIELSTEARAREREKFEEARRAREAELERQREERRRQQELEEEREIKELRKRAVPKANEVPEWYAFAPKKSKTGTGN
ncbi:hypothetical protein OH77DRAFT_1425745 [Trametes cingulata]|nr:hypothetical protein OH77DRAFT_1425745 [Trametes cingulata]